MPSSSMWAYVGTYTDPLDDETASGPGLMLIEIDPETGAMHLRGLVSSQCNPSFVICEPPSGFVFAVRESFDDLKPAVLAYRRADDGSLSFINAQRVPGELPCHLAMSPDGRWLAVATYQGGTVSVYPVLGAGGLGAATCCVRHAGRGSSKLGRQSAPHAHCVLFDGTSGLLVSDLGLNLVIDYPFDAETGIVSEVGKKELSVPGGAGPRHIALSPDRSVLFVLCELDESLVSFRRAGRRWTIASRLEIFGGGAEKNGATAALRQSSDGRHIYVSGRRQNEIAVIDLSDSAPRVVARTASGGVWPRDVAISPDGRFLLAANQHSGNLCLFRRNGYDGSLVRLPSELGVSGAAVIAFAPLAT